MIPNWRSKWWIYWSLLCFRWILVDYGGKIRVSDGIKEEKLSKFGHADITVCCLPTKKFKMITTSCQCKDLTKKTISQTSTQTNKIPIWNGRTKDTVTHITCMITDSCVIDPCFNSTDNSASVLVHVLVHVFLSYFSFILIKINDIYSTMAYIIEIYWKQHNITVFGGETLDKPS